MAEPTDQPAGENAVKQDDGRVWVDPKTGFRYTHVRYMDMSRKDVLRLQRQARRLRRNFPWFSKEPL